MKKLSIVITFLLAAVILMPPICIRFPMPVDMALWAGMVLIFAFIGFSMLRGSLHGALKVMIVYLFINAFLSSCPYASFNAYCAFVACLALYAVFLKIVDWRPIMQGIEGAFWVICVLLIMQYLKKDSLLSFPRGNGVLYGCAMNKMMMASILACMAPFLIKRSRMYLIPIIPVLFIHNYASSFMTRCPAWVATVKLSIIHPFVGWGMGSFKFMFMALTGQIRGGKWAQAHNDYLQTFFEIGLIGVILAAIFISSVVIKCRGNKIKLAGLAIIGADMMFHFPCRMIQTVPLILLWLAYCERGNNGHSTN